MDTRTSWTEIPISPRSWPGGLTLLSILVIQVTGAVLEDAVADLAVESWSSSVWTALNDLCLSNSRLKDQPL